MTTLSIPTKWDQRFDVEAFVAALLLPVCVCLLGPWWSVYQFHPDEGVNLLKGALIANGFSLYDQIWSDQPPVLNLILAVVHLVFPYNVAAARTVILAFASLLLWSLSRIVRRSDGNLAAGMAVVALGTSNLFLTLSVSVMIGLPAIALALCALDQVMVGASKQEPQRLLLAGLLFGISLQIKMWTALMLPSLICAALIIPNGQTHTDPRRLRNIGLMLAVALGAFLAIAVAMREPLLAELIYPHLWNQGTITNDYSEFHGWIYFGGLLAQEPVILGLGAAGVVTTLLRPRDFNGVRLIPILWLCVSVITFAYHRPVWPHHLPMTLVPLAWLGGNAVAMSVAWLRTIGAQRWHLIAFAGIFFAAVIIVGIPNAPDFRSDVPVQNPIASAMVEFRSYPPAEPWVVTDAGMDAYRAGVLVPPELVVFTGKRVSGGYVPADLIISVIRDRKPSQVMFRRFPIDREVERYLNDSGYVRMIWSAEPHYIRGDLAHAKSG